MNANAIAVALLALATALIGCGPTASDPDVDEDVESSGSEEDDEGGDDGASRGDDGPSHGGAFFDEGGGDDEGTDDDGGVDVEGDGGASVGVEGDEGDEGDESSDSGEVPPEDVACLDMQECLIGHPYAVEPCAASFDVVPTQCGITPICARNLEWVDSAGTALVPPDDFQVSYNYFGESEFHNVGSVCFDPEDGHSCVAPCRLPALKPVEAIRISYGCGSAPSHTFQAKVATLGETIQLICASGS